MVPIGESLAKYVVSLVRATRHKSENAPDFVKKYVNYGGSITCGAVYCAGGEGAGIEPQGATT